MEVKPVTGTLRFWREGERNFSDSLRTNVPQTTMKKDGWNIGYYGSCARELALNCLNAVIPPKSDREESVPTRVGIVSATALRLHIHFAKEWIAKLPVEGGSIEVSDIETWVQAKKKRMKHD